jgi:hypothetical protein
MYPRAEFIESLKAKLAEEGLQAAAPELMGVNLWGGRGLVQRPDYLPRGCPLLAGRVGGRSE